jgi:nucleoside-diphosphate-sugar epimerase
MKVLVTGAGGRIGTHLCHLLLAQGHDVRAFGVVDDPNLLALGPAGAEVVTGDLELPETLTDAVSGVDAVCHLAAALTTHDVSDDRYVDVNLRGTFNVLEAARRGAPDLQRFVYTSSDAVYWSTAATDGPIDETHALLPGTVYGATKVGAELLCRSFWQTYGIPFTTMRPTATANPAELIRADSVFGRRWFLQSAISWYSARVAPSPVETSLLTALLAADDGTDKLFALVNPDGVSSLSSFGDARDAAAGMRAMIEPAAAIGEAFNIGPATPHSDRELVEYIGERLGLPVVEIRHAAARPTWNISSQKAQDRLDYRPTRSVFTMIDEAVAQLAATGGRPA